MRIDDHIILDFLSALALLAILCWCYGLIRQRVFGDHLGPIVMGVLFGLVALVQMHAPLQPVEGLILDLRAVPVALAGAYLGRRGLAACLAVALVTRWQIGGIGMVPDLVAIILAGAAGAVWDRATRHHLPRRAVHLVALGLAVSAPVLTAALLPAPLSTWVLANAAPVLALLNLAAVPMLAALLERERHALLIERALLAQATARARDGMLSQPRFLDLLRRLRHSTASGLPTGPPVVAVLVLQLEQRQVSARRSEAVLAHVLSGLRDRLPQLVCHGDQLGITEEGRILIALAAGDLAQVDTVIASIRRAVAESAVALPDGDSARVGVAAVPVRLGDAMTQAEIAARLDTAIPGHGGTFRPIPHKDRGLAVRPPSQRALRVPDAPMPNRRKP